MGLADRLRAAEQERQERLRAAGMSLLADLTAEPQSDEPTVIDLTGPTPVIDLRTPADTSETAATTDLGGTCPLCGGPTRVDLQGVIGGMCLECGHLSEPTY